MDQYSDLYFWKLPTEVEIDLSDFQEDEKEVEQKGRKEGSSAGSSEEKENKNNIDEIAAQKNNDSSKKDQVEIKFGDLLISFDKSNSKLADKKESSTPEKKYVVLEPIPLPKNITETEAFSDFHFWRDPIASFELDLKSDLEEINNGTKKNKSYDENNDKEESYEVAEEEEENNDEPTTEELTSKLKVLVLDTAAFLTEKRFDHLAETFVTVPEVIHEVRNEEARRRLSLLHVDVVQREPSPESIKRVADFARKTGDYASLSKTDLKVLALALMLEIEVMKTDEYIRNEPLKPQTSNGSSQSNSNGSIPSLPAGFVAPIHDVNTPASTTVDEDDGWITPSNVKKMREKQMNLAEKSQRTRPILVGCMTSDFAMQNVLLQLGICLLSVDGKEIKNAKSWVLRCHACFKSTTNMDKKFCPTCGGNTLIRTSVSVDSNGQMTYYLKRNFQYRLRGTKYSIPNPKSGRRVDNIILREDQKEYQNKVKAQKKKEEDLYTLDYELGTFGNSDRHPRNTGGPVIGYGRRNPNEPRKKSGRRK